MTDPERQDEIGELHLAPATAASWQHLEALFGSRGACGGCWCIWWRLPRKSFEEGKGLQNKARLRELLDADTTSGVLAYANDSPVGWAAVGPVQAFPRLQHSSSLAPIPSQAWAVPCLLSHDEFAAVG